jgi:hypothetical protein
MIREPVVIIQPGRNASRLGNHRVREFPSIIPFLCARSLYAGPFFKENTGEVVEAADLIWIVRHLWFRLGDP